MTTTASRPSAELAATMTVGALRTAYALHSAGRTDADRVFADAIKAELESRGHTITPPAGIVVEHKTDRWVLRTQADLTDDQAAALTWVADDPKQVVLGTFVEVIDAGGTRIGELTMALYRRRTWGPSYVVCSATLL